MRIPILTVVLTALVALSVVAGATAQSPAPNPHQLCGGACGGGNGGGISCTVTANNPHMSTSVRGAASGDGITSCNTTVDIIESKTALYRYSGGSWIGVGDQNNVLNSHANWSSITSTSKENPCRGGASYIDYSYGYAAVGGVAIINGTDENWGPYGNGYVLC